MKTATEKLHEFAAKLPIEQGIELMQILAELTQEQIDTVERYRNGNPANLPTAENHIHEYQAA